MQKEDNPGIIEVMNPIANLLSQKLESYDQPPRKLNIPSIHPLKIVCSVECEGNIETGPDKDPVTSKRPGWVAITPDVGPRSKGQESVYIMLHESIPPQFKPIVYFHEVMEASTAHHMKRNFFDSHQIAEKLTDNFAKNRLSNREYKRFINWKKKLNY